MLYAQWARVLAQCVWRSCRLRSCNDSVTMAKCGGHVPRHTMPSTQAMKASQRGAKRKMRFSRSWTRRGCGARCRVKASERRNVSEAFTLKCVNVSRSAQPSSYVPKIAQWRFMPFVMLVPFLSSSTEVVFFVDRVSRDRVRASLV